MNKKLLIAKPWLGEFGWELFGWQGHIRYLVSEKEYDAIVVGIRPGHEILYQDFATHYLYDDRKGDSKGPNFNYKSPDFTKAASIKLDRAFNSYIGWDVDTVQPCIQLCHKISVNHEYQKFVKYGKTTSDKSMYDVIIHPRNLSDHNLTTGADWRDYPLDRWNKIVTRLSSKNLKIGMIGIKDKTHTVKGIDDLRGVSLQKLANILKNSKCIVGPSSGPIHLASLCGCPQIVWTDKKKNLHGIFTNRQRYEKIWNPFDTKVKVIDHQNWKPDVDIVVDETFKLINP